MTKPPERIHVLVGGSPVCRVLRQEWLLEPSEIAVTVEYIRADLATQRTPDPAVQALVDIAGIASAHLHQLARDRDLSEGELDFMRRVDAALAAFDKTD